MLDLDLDLVEYLFWSWEIVLACYIGYSFFFGLINIYIYIGYSYWIELGKCRASFENWNKPMISGI